MMKYTGNGWLHGIPARDLTDEEVKKFGEKRLIESGLYKKVSIEKEVKHGHQGATQDSIR